MMADEKAPAHLVDDEADQEALERYYERRIREIRQEDGDVRRGRSWSLADLKRLADEQPAHRRRS